MIGLRVVAPICPLARRDMTLPGRTLPLTRLLSQTLVPDLLLVTDTAAVTRRAIQVPVDDGKAAPAESKRARLAEASSPEAETDAQRQVNEDLRAERRPPAPGSERYHVNPMRA